MAVLQGWQAAECFKYRRKMAPPLILLLLLLAAGRGGADEVYRCDNRTLTCVTEGVRGQPRPHCRGKTLLEGPGGYLSDGPGNYSTDAKCTWVIRSSSPNATIRVRLLEFATECSWDHLYVFDGDSVMAPLLAVYSGLTLTRDYQLRQLNQLVSSSDVLVLHFYSDLSYNMTGFNISYSIGSCPADEAGRSCAGRGACVDGVCTCDAGYHGVWCQHEICPRRCNQPHGQCNMETHGCVCDEGWSGLDCSQPRDRGFWTSVTSATPAAPAADLRRLARSQSSGAVWKGVLWVVGGHGSQLQLPFAMAFNISRNEWTSVETKGAVKPSGRHGHSTVVHEGVLYVYGGCTAADGGISAQLWALNLTSKHWSLLSLPDSTYGAGGRCNLVHPHGQQQQQRVLCAPVAACGHSAVLVKDKMYVIFGYNGVYGYLNWVQELDLDAGHWSVVPTTGALVQGTYGHSSVWDPLTKRIYVYGGYQSESSLTYGLTDAFYSLDPALKVWRTHPSSGSHRFLHSAVMSGGLMVVFGGNTHNETAASHGAKCYSADFLAYDTVCDSWYRLPQASAQSVGGDLARYGHLAASFGPTSDADGDEEEQQPLLPYGMLVFGGFDGQLKSDVLVYVVGSCTSLTTKEHCLTAMPGVKCVWNKAAKKCEPLTSISKEGYEKCPVVSLSGEGGGAWASGDGPAAPMGVSINYTTLCSSIGSCPTCLHTTFNCVWCGHSCQYARCKDAPPGSTGAGGGSAATGGGLTVTAVVSASRTVAVTSLEQCDVGDANTCRLLHSCWACHTEPHCRWEPDARCYTFVRKVGNKTEKVEIVKDDQMCDVPCSWRTSCRNCTQGPCLWCANQNRCVDKNAYIPSFPHGLCTEWTTHEAKCRPADAAAASSGAAATGETSLLLPAPNLYTKMTTCKSYRSCSDCLEDPACGWCDDGSNRGTGTCLPGGWRGALHAAETCPVASRWYFTECPLCQCNGHSTCIEGSRGLCHQPCQDLTEGAHCETCISGYFGNPVNGGTCSPCQCSGHGTQCHQLTGRCFCTTKGVVGDHCERCDVANHYTSGLLTLSGPPSGNVTSTAVPVLPTCYYDLQLDFQFTFNLSKKEDRHIRQINFRNVPLKPDLDLEFNVMCSGGAKINISVRSTANAKAWSWNEMGEGGAETASSSVAQPGEERFLMVNHSFTSFKSRFLHAEYPFGSEENTTFYVYVYDFRSPIWIVVSFTQHPLKLELQQFFITFSACFLSLLLAAAIMWKIKQKYDLYRRRQRLFVEMEQMASRPFSHVLVELHVPPFGVAPARPPLHHSQPPPPTEAAALHAEASTPTLATPVSNKTVVVHTSAATVETSFSSAASPYPSSSASTSQALRRRRRFRPSPIALEPCADQKAAVLSLLIRLPNGSLAHTPPGQSGLAIASTLVSLGAHSARAGKSAADAAAAAAASTAQRPSAKNKTRPNVGAASA